MLKKLLLSCFFLLIIVAVAAPFGIGMMIEKQYNNNLTQLNTFYNGALTFSGTFKSGYLTSSAVTTIMAQDAALPVTLNHMIHNGPVFLNFQGAANLSSYLPNGYGLANISTTFDDKVSKTIADIYKGQSGYSFTSLLDFSGNGTTNIVFDPLVTTLDAKNIDWKGLQITVLHNVDLSFVTGNMTMPSIIFTEVGADGADSNMAKALGINIAFSTGVGAINETVGVDVANVAVSEAGASIFTAEKLSFSGKSQMVGSLAKSDLAYGFKSLTFGDDHYGPFSFTVNLKNLNTSVLKELVAKTSQASSQLVLQSSGVDNNPSIAETYDYKLTTEQTVAFLSVRPGVAINFKLEMPKGKVALIASLDIGGSDIKADDDAAVLASATASLSLSVDQPIVYYVLAQIAQDNINSKSQQFANTNTDQSIVNPYVLTPEQMQKAIELWTISVLDLLKEQNFIVEKDLLITSDVKYDKSVLTFNTQEKTMSDLEALYPTFDQVVKTTGTGAASTTVPSAVVPSAAVPSTIVPSTTVPSAAVPSTTVPSAAVPSTTVPSAAVPSTTVPSTTAPSTTAPSTTAPSTTAPSTTVPSAVVPSTTVPSTTAPIIRAPSKNN